MIHLNGFQALASIAAASLCASTALSGQASWKALLDGGNVPFIPSSSTAYDASRDRVVLYSRVCDGRSAAFTWEFDGSRWLPLFPAVSPPVRTDPHLVYDPHRKRTVLFGGSGPRNDLWEWDGTTWNEQVTTVRPSVRFGHVMAYDEMRRCVVLFSGRDNGGTVFDDTWTWDGTAWQEQMPVTRPPGRPRAGIAYDPLRGRIVMFGGVTASPLIELNDTWEWDGTDWTEVQTGIESPPARSLPGLAYDPQRRQTILFGGNAGNLGGFSFADTWGFDGQRWTQLATPGSGPLGRAGPGMVYDSRLGRILMFGGSTFPLFGRNCFADMWVLDTPTPGIAGFGAGCVGAAWIPLLTLAPRSGSTLGLHLSQLSALPSTAAFFAFGASRQHWAGLSLPAPLTGPCSLWIGLDVVLPVLPHGGAAELSLRVPGSLTFHVQGLAVDSAGLSLSSAVSVGTVP